MVDNSASNSGVKSQNSAARALLILYCKGICMGLGDSVPGVSGGTIAVITQIYDELIYSIRSVDEAALALVLGGKIKQAWRHINGTFLLTLALGILSGLLVAANTVLYLLENQYEAVMGFFTGLVLASCVLLLSHFRLHKPSNLLAVAAGATLTGLAGLLDPVTSNLSLIYLFFCGMLAISAMLLPGLSGAFILLLLGAYEPMLTALTGLEWAVIAVFVSGCAVGILAFSRLLAWALRRFHEVSYSLITGLLLGSLTVLWPWQQVRSDYADSIDSDGVQQALHTVNVWPLNYTEQTGLEPHLAPVLVCAIVGLLAVIILHRVFRHRPNPE